MSYFISISNKGGYFLEKTEEAIIKIVNAYMQKYNLSGKDWYVCIETILRAKIGGKNNGKKLC